VVRLLKRQKQLITLVLITNKNKTKMNKSNKNRRLVKKVCYYSNGDVTESTYSGKEKTAPTWCMIARFEKSAVREYKEHYQVQVRVEKTANVSLLANEIFTSSVDTLSQMLLIKRKSSVKNGANESECD
jgi:hypothetical protein